MKKKLYLLLTLLLAVAMLPACSKKKEEEKEPVKEEREAVVEEEEKEPEPEPEEPIPANQNLLTGIPDLTDAAIGKRPVAVMVNNIPKAIPQYGIEKADIIFEIPVEGDQTRFMALYADYTTIPQICPIRSCRYYFPALSQGFDAFYVNWGIDDSIADYLELLQLDQYDGISGQGGFFGRDQERLNAGYALEHTGYFDGTKFASVVQAEGRRLDLTEDKRDPAFSFNGLNEQLKPEGSDCTRIDINFGQQSAALT